MSKYFSLGIRDWVVAFIMFVLGTVLTTIQQMITTDGIQSVDWKVVGTVALGSSITYIVKNLLTQYNPSTDTEKVAGIKISGN